MVSGGNKMKKIFNILAISAIVSVIFGITGCSNSNNEKLPTESILIPENTQLDNTESSVSELSDISTIPNSNHTSKFVSKQSEVSQISSEISVHSSNIPKSVIKKNSNVQNEKSSSPSTQPASNQNSNTNSENSVTTQINTSSNSENSDSEYKNGVSKYSIIKSESSEPKTSKPINTKSENSETVSQQTNPQSENSETPTQQSSKAPELSQIDSKYQAYYAPYNWNEIIADLRAVGESEYGMIWDDSFWIKNKGLDFGSDMDSEYGYDIVNGHHQGTASYTFPTRNTDTYDGKDFRDSCINMFNVVNREFMRDGDTLKGVRFKIVVEQISDKEYWVYFIYG